MLDIFKVSGMSIEESRKDMTGKRLEYVQLSPRSSSNFYHALDEIESGQQKRKSGRMPTHYSDAEEEGTSNRMPVNF